MTDIVRAAVQVAPRQIELREFPRPRTGPDDGLLRVEANGICGSDVETYRGYLGGPRPAFIPGHEPLGIIEEVGERAAQAELGTALVMISHDLALAASHAEEILVMYAGRVVERACAADLFGNVAMPYTRALLDAIPRVELEPHVLLPVIGGRPPDLSAAPPGCAFAPRCPVAQQDCGLASPLFEEHEIGHWWACWHPCESGRGAKEAAAP